MSKGLSLKSESLIFPSYYQRKTNMPFGIQKAKKIWLIKCLEFYKLGCNGILSKNRLPTFD